MPFRSRYLYPALRGLRPGAADVCPLLAGQRGLAYRLSRGPGGELFAVGTRGWRDASAVAGDRPIFADTKIGVSGRLAVPAIAACWLSSRRSIATRFTAKSIPSCSFARPCSSAVTPGNRASVLCVPPAAGRRREGSLKNSGTPRSQRLVVPPSGGFPEGFRLKAGLRAACASRPRPGPECGWRRPSPSRCCRHCCCCSWPWCGRDTDCCCGRSW